MSKPPTGTPRSVQISTFASCSSEKALLTDRRVVIPPALPKSTSKYGNSSGAAGFWSMSQITAAAGTAAKPATARQTAARFIAGSPFALYGREAAGVVTGEAEKKKARLDSRAPLTTSDLRLAPGYGTKWLAAQALSSLTASKPTLYRPSALITISTQAWAADGSSGGLLPAAATVVFRSRNSQPKSNSTGKSAPPICVDCVSAGKGMIPCCGGCGEIGNVCGTCGCSCSSKITIPSWPNGYQAGVVPHLKAPCLTFESRHTTNRVPPLKAPPLMKRPANSVASGSRLSTAVQA